MGNMINSSLFEMQMIASQIFIFFYFFLTIMVKLYVPLNGLRGNYYIPLQWS